MAHILLSMILAVFFGEVGTENAAQFSLLDNIRGGVILRHNFIFVQ
jgi:hypothetical protein